jgi:hypothetical protein
MTEWTQEEGVWIKNVTGICPVPYDTLVKLRFREGTQSLFATKAGAWNWSFVDGDGITAYQIADETKADSPNEHYRQGEIECIDAIRAALTDDEWRGYCKGNVLKYVWREKHKGGDLSLIKAEDYLRWALAGKAEDKR